MKKLIPFLLLITLIVSSCGVYRNHNNDNEKKVKDLYIGMSKQEALEIMGDKYIVELISQEDDGLLEVLKFEAIFYPYLLHFLNDKLTTYNLYYPPCMPEQEIRVKKEEN